MNSTIDISKDILNITYNGTELGLLGKPISLSTLEKMNLALNVKNVGKAYKYTGETNDNYTSGNIYIVKEATDNSIEFEHYSAGDGGAASINETEFLWAWKKKERQEVTQNVNVTITVKIPATSQITQITQINVTASQLINQVTVSDLYGMTIYYKDSDGFDEYFTIGSDGKIRFYVYGSNLYPTEWWNYHTSNYSYNTSTHVITLSSANQNHFPNGASGTKTVTKPKQTITEVQIGVVTDENKNAYPHNAFADDGYYYVRTGPNTTEAFKYFEHIIEGNKAALLAVGSTGSNVYGNYKTGTDWGSFTKLT